MDTSKPGAAPTAMLRHLQGGNCLTLDQIVDALGVSRRQVSNAASILLRRGYLMKMAVGCYQLTEEGISAARAGVVITSGPIGKRATVARRRDTFRQRAWNSIRFNRRFTISQIVRAAARDGDGNARANANKYVSLLCRAGYVRELPRRAPGTAPSSPGFKRFMLVRDTGRLAPVFREELRSMHDFNTGEDVPCAPR